MSCLQFSDLGCSWCEFAGSLIWCGLYNTVVRFGLPFCFAFAFVDWLVFGFEVSGYLLWCFGLVGVIVWLVFLF